MKTAIQKQSLDFLKVLAKNNNRDWFNENKNKFVDAQASLITFADALIAEMNKQDRIETESGKKALFRIYKDVRFSKDKTPYNTHWSGILKRATKQLRGSYYFNIQPGNSRVMIGFWGPNADDMKRIRNEFEFNHEAFETILNNKTFKKTFGEMRGEQLTSAPRGYDKNHEAIKLLRYKQFLLRHDFTDEEVLSSNFVTKVCQVYQCARPFLDFMSDALTLNENGESIV